jgi:hypothetical protein
MVTNCCSKALLHLQKGLVISTIFCAGRGIASSDHAGNPVNNGDGGVVVDNDGGGVVNNSGGVVNNSGGGVNNIVGGVNSSGGAVNNSGGFNNTGGGFNNSSGAVNRGGGSVNSGDVVINSGDAVNNGGGDVIYGSGGVNDGGGMVINGGEVVLVVQGRHIPASRRTLALVSNFFKVCCSISSVFYPVIFVPSANSCPFHLIVHLLFLPVLWNRNWNRNRRNRNFLTSGTGTGTITCLKVGTGTVINYGFGTGAKHKIMYLISFHKHIFHSHFTINLLKFMNIFLVKQFTK